MNEISHRQVQVSSSPWNSFIFYFCPAHIFSVRISKSIFSTTHDLRQAISQPVVRPLDIQSYSPTEQSK